MLAIKGNLFKDTMLIPFFLEVNQEQEQILNPDSCPNSGMLNTKYLLSLDHCKVLKEALDLKCLDMILSPGSAE